MEPVGLLHVAGLSCGCCCCWCCCWCWNEYVRCRLMWRPKSFGDAVEFGGDWCTVNIYSFDVDNYVYYYRLHIITTTLCGNREGRLERCFALTVLPLHLARVKMFLLPRPWILEPHLRYPLAKSGYVRYPLEILPVGIAVQLKIRLENGELLLGKSGSNSLRLITTLVATLGVTAFCESSN